MKILVVGGAGYLGSHVARECRRAGAEPVILDNFSTGSREAVDGIEQIDGSLLDPRVLRSTFQNDDYDAVVHLAGGASVPRAFDALSRHYQGEIAGTLNLVQAMVEGGVSRLVFGSSVRVYGEPVEVPIDESVPTGPADPVGQGKLCAERLIAEVSRGEPIRFAALRFFTVAGADVAGDLGDSRQTDDHLIPAIFQAGLGRQPSLTIHGNDYDTPDASCIRDFVHVSDCARACLLALESIDDRPNEIYNIGSGEGYSALEVIEEAQKLLPNPLQVKVAERRRWEPAALVASIEKARSYLGWEPEHSELTEILESAWAWHRRHPHGFAAMAPSMADRESVSPELFGDIATRLGLVTPSDVVRALERQQHEMEEGLQHKLIGMHMLEMGLLSTSDLIEILKFYEEK